MKLFCAVLLLSLGLLGHSAMGEFVRFSGSAFSLKGRPFIPVGFNAHWLGIDEEFEYPSQKRIEEMFQVAEKMSATAIRSHTVGHSSGHTNSLRPLDRELNEKAWPSIDTALAMARKYDVRLIVPLTDNWFWYNGNYGNYCTPYGLPKNSFWTDRRVVDDFKDYITRYLNHVNTQTRVALKDDPYIFLIETGNELGNSGKNADSIPPESWIREISSHIKSVDSNHLVLDGCDASLGQSNNFHIDSVDVYSRHFYSDDIDSLNASATEAGKVGKPLIVGEFDSGASESWLAAMESNPNVKGTLFWHMYGHDDNGNRIRHNDGYTLYYKEESSQPALLRLANHARRIRNLPLLDSLL